MPLYLFVLLGAVSIPLLYTLFVFDVIQKWRYFFISTSLVACVFLTWDAVFTAHSVWGFNMDYCVGYKFFGMPIEEWLFFIMIPFVCVFTHLVLKQKLPNFKLQEYASKTLSFVLIFITLAVFLTNLDKLYTSINALVLLITLIVGAIFYPKELQRFYLSFLIIITPFFIVNGTLTGMFTNHPIVWYNDLENLQLRALTIPIEDFGYAFSMLFSNIMIYNYLINRKEYVYDKKD